MSQFMNEDQIKSNIGYGTLFKKLWPYGKRHKGMLFFSIFSIVGLAVSSRLLPTIVGYAIDNGVVPKDRHILFVAAIFYMSAVVAKVFFQFSFLYYFQKFGNRVLFYVREDLIKHVQDLPIGYFNKTPAGRIITRITNDVAQLGDLFTDGVVNIITEFTMLMAILVAMLLISVKLTLIVLVTAPIFIYLSIILSDQIRLVLRDSKKKLSEINSFVAENINGIKVIRLFNRLDRNHGKFKKLSTEYRDLVYTSVKKYAFMPPIMNLFSAVNVFSALYFGSIIKEQDHLAVGMMVAFFMHVLDFIPPLREILEKYQQFQNSLTSAERVFNLLDEKTEMDPIGVAPLKKADHIELRNLNFRYEEHLPLVLKNINLKIPQGKSYAFVGRTGSGKSTLITLMQKFYSAPENTLFIDGVPIEKIGRKALRRHIGVVQQDPFIFRGTIKDNITLADKTISEDLITEAVRLIDYQKLLDQSGRTLDSAVDERGANLSVGERQLIAFARILVFQPSIIILDEATANIDSQSEKLIQEATEKVTRGRTSLIIAHRLSTIEKCDQIVFIDHGEIKEVGTHKELMEKKTFYYQVASAGLKSTEIVSNAPGIASP